MNKEDICYMPAYEMAEKIKTQELTSLEITEILIERIEKLNAESSMKEKIFAMANWIALTCTFNLSGNPAASIPCGWSKEGLPIGLQIVGNRFEELTVLQASKAFEDLSPWQGKKPAFF